MDLRHPEGPMMLCPACQEPLGRKDQGWSCSACGREVPEVEGLPDLIPPGSEALKLSEREHYTEQIDYYLGMHAAWSSSPFYRHYHHAFLSRLEALGRGACVLELGCGLGHDGLEMLRAGLKVAATDIAPGSLAEARRLHCENGFGDDSTHLLMDAESLPFADGAFDGVLLVAALHHLPDPARALAEAHRVLKPGGLLVLGTEPNNWQGYTIYPAGKFLLRLVLRLLGRWEERPDHVSEADKLTEGFSGRQLRGLLERAGFERIELEAAGYLSAAVFFATTEASELAGRPLRLFFLESLFIPADGLLARLPLLRRYPWHWNAYATR
jgi:ubiquinone/menaquinone biosynthesis C-methylase UbiE